MSLRSQHKTPIVTRLELPHTLSVQGLNAGMVVSRPEARHMSRVCQIFDLIFVREGVLSMHEEGRPFTVKAGQSLLLWPERSHGGTADYSPDLRFFWLHFTVLQTPNPEEKTLSVPQLATVARPDFLTELFLRYIGDQEAKRNQLFSDSLMTLLILSEIAAPLLPEIDDSSAVLAGRAYAFIRTRYRHPLTPAAVAEHVGCNPQYLSRVFRRTYHQTMTDAIYQTRMEYARRLLTETNKNITEIAHACGFTDPRYFYRVFHRQEGMTALAFRRLFARTYINVE